MLELYPKQEEVANNLLKIYQTKDHISHGALYLSGEMGVGKTYIGSYLVNVLSPHCALIIVPSLVLNKWQNVLQGFTKQEITVINRKSNKLGHINLCTYQNLKYVYQLAIKNQNLLVDYPKNNQRLLRNLNNRSRDIILPLQDFDSKQYKIHSAKSFEKPKIDLPFDFIVADEVHLLKPSHLDFAILYTLLRNSQKRPKFLGLTGTLFNQNIENLLFLIATTNPELLKGLNALNINENYNLNEFLPIFQSAADFYTRIWCYLGAQLSLTDLKQKSQRLDSETKQEIMPLNGIQLTKQQRLWLEIAGEQMKDNSQKKIDLISANYLDLPERKQPVITHHSLISNIENSDNKYYKISKDYAGMALDPIKLEKTPKFKQLLTILKNNPEPTLILTVDSTLTSRLATSLNANTLPKNIATGEIANYINSRLKQNSLFVVEARKISVGIDLNRAQNIVWYQIPLDVALIQQTQRRVLRLNNLDQKSKIWFLFYLDTKQADIITQVSQSAVKNAATYNVRQNDNLAKLTKILFKGLGKQHEAK